MQLGLTGALDTLCGQAYGSKRYNMLGVHAQRAMLVIAGVSIPVITIWIYLGKILLFLKQDPDIAREAGIFVRWLTPSIFGFGLLQCEIKFLQTQNIVFPMVFVSGLTALLHLPLSWFLVLKSGLGLRGAALSLDISYWLDAILLAIYIKFSNKCKTTWTGLSKQAFKDTQNFIKLGVPSAFMVWSVNSLFS